MMTELVVMLIAFPVSSHPMPPDVPQPSSSPDKDEGAKHYYLAAIVGCVMVLTLLVLV